jgi:predicted regulator of Ras-like GTPase activity (Roadblock/LC7/MglB family)
MPVAAPSWSFTQDDADIVAHALRRLLQESGARCVLLVDRGGQLVTTVGDQPAFDPAAFATLTAADFSANDQLARLIGETDFSSLFHQGERESIFLSDVARRVILVVLFENRLTTVGLVRLMVRQAIGDLTPLFQRITARDAGGAARGVLAGAEHEIDQLFR